MLACPEDSFENLLGTVLQRAQTNLSLHTPQYHPEPFYSPCSEILGKDQAQNKAGVIKGIQRKSYDRSNYSGLEIRDRIQAQFPGMLETLPDQVA